ncbi:MAG: YciI family protein [Solirubrobacterales bacterium]
MAQYLLSVHTVEGEAAEPMTDEQMQELMRKVGELEQDMNAANALVYSGRLADVDTATVVRVERGETLTTDGPFAEAKEHLGGFYIVNANDIDEALSWASKTAACVGRPIEVRPFFEMPGA